MSKKYRSKFEGRVAAALPKQARYEADTLPYVLELEYTPDWTLGRGKDPIYLEAKGKFDYIERRKVLAVINNNPGIDLRMIFMRNNRLNKRSETTYGAWCDKHGIRWSVFPELPI